VRWGQLRTQRALCGAAGGPGKPFGSPPINDTCHPPQSTSLDKARKGAPPLTASASRSCRDLTRLPARCLFVPQLTRPLFVSAPRTPLSFSLLPKTGEAFDSALRNLGSTRRSSCKIPRSDHAFRRAFPRSNFGLSAPRGECASRPGILQGGWHRS
jgi:hypothetical protein